MFSGIYQNLNVLVTGHTGFKGSWLLLWLEKLGAKVSGISLPPTENSHYNLLDVKHNNFFVDIRNYDDVAKVVAEVSPDIVFHLAAQPIVKESYILPVDTWSTNVIGTLNVLEACRKSADVKAFLNITTDKVYRNEEIAKEFKESDVIEGKDPYSASKSACELLTTCYTHSYPDSSMKVISLRAGNVIGGGDWGADRLVTDIINAAYGNEHLAIRNSNAVRPWQHVLDCLSGYLSVGEAALVKKLELSAVNIGPDLNCCISVQEMLELCKKELPNLTWHCMAEKTFKESLLLRLDNSLAKDKLNWQPVWQIREALQDTVEWYKRYYEKGEVAS